MSTGEPAMDRRTLLLLAPIAGVLALLGRELSGRQPRGSRMCP